MNFNPYTVKVKHRIYFSPWQRKRIAEYGACNPFPKRLGDLQRTHRRFNGKQK